MANDPSAGDRNGTPYRRRTVIGALVAGAGAAALGTGAAQAQEGATDGGAQPDWLPADASGAHIAVLSGSQADESTRASGCAHVTPLDEENTVVVDLVLEDIQCLTQAHIHEGERGEDGPIVAPLLEITGEIDGSGDDDPITAAPDTPIVAGATVDDEEVVGGLLENPGQYYVNVHTVHEPAGEIRGQFRGFDSGQETEIEPQPASFAVSTLDPEDGTVVQGDSLDVSATVANEGDVEETQTIELAIEGEVVDERDLELGCRSASTVSFDVDTDDLEPGDYEHEISSADDAASGSLTVLTPPEFDVSGIDPQNGTVTQGDVIEVSATVENVGQATGAQTIWFRVDGEPLAEQDLELDGGESASVTFESIDTTDLAAGEFEHGVFSEDDSATGTLTVQTPPEFDVSDLDPQEASVAQGDPIDVAATVENLGDASGTATVQFRVDDDTLAAQEVALDGGQSQSVSFEALDTAPLDPGEYTHGVYTMDDADTGTLTVEAAPGTEEPGTETPGTETPGTEEPGTATPGTEGPGTETPGTEEPGTETPGTEEPGTATSGTEEPGTETPGTEPPGTDEPGT